MHKQGEVTEGLLLLSWSGRAGFGWDLGADRDSGLSCWLELQQMCGALIALGFGSTLSISMKQDLWSSSFLLIMQLYRKHVLSLGLHVSSGARRWNFKTVLTLLTLSQQVMVQPWYKTSVTFLFGKSVKLHSITNWLPACTKGIWR